MKPIALILYGLLLAASLVWSVVFLDFGPFDRVPLGPESGNWSLAQAFTSGSMDAATLGRSGSPVYPLVLSTYAHHDIETARVIQRTVFLAVTSVLLLLLLIQQGVRGFPAMVGSLAPFFVAPLIVSASTLAPGYLAGLFLLTAVVFLSMRFNWASLGAGTLFAAAALWTLPSVGWAAAVVFVVLLFTLRKHTPKSVPAVFGVGVLVLSLLLGQVLNTRDLLPRIPGVEIYQGHRIGSQGGPPLVTDEDSRRYWGRAEYRAHGSRQAERSLTLREMQGFWLKQGALEAVKNLPAEVLRTGKKVWLTVRAESIPNPVSASFVASKAEKPGLAISIWAARILIPLGIASWFLSRRRRQYGMGLALATGFAAGFLVFAGEDTRVLTLILLCGGVAHFLAELPRGRALLTGGAGIALLGVLPFVLAGDSRKQAAMDDYWLGVVYAEEARGSAALRSFDLSLAKDADSPLPRLAVARLLAEDQIVDEAIRELEAVREAYPDLVAPLEILDQLYRGQERWSENEIILNALVNLNPFEPAYHTRLGVNHLSSGYLQRAEAAFRKALEIDPSNPEAQQNLTKMQSAGFATREDTTGAGASQVMALMRQGNFAQAKVALEKAYAVPGVDSLQLQFLEGTLYFQEQDFARAIELFEPLLPVYGEQIMFRHNVAAAYASVGRTDEAFTIWVDLVKKYPSHRVFRQSLGQLEQMTVAKAREASGAEARGLWELLIKHFPTKAAYQDSLNAAGR